MLRIEDTDAERSSAEMVDGILDSMRWLGLDWDEGPGVERTARALLPVAALRPASRRRRAAGRVGPRLLRLHAARRLRARPAGSRRRSGETWRYDRARYAVTPERARRARGRRARAARSASRCPTGSTAFTDLVHGPVEFDNVNVEDFVILRSDGVPTYHLSVVCDDIDMRITHVDSRRRSRVEHAEARAAVRRARRAAAAVRPRAADPRRRQEAPEQAARRDVGARVRAPGLPAGGDGQLPRAARLVARRRSRAVLRSRGAGAGVLARRHQRGERGVQHREARVDEQPAHHAHADRRSWRGASSR